MKNNSEYTDLTLAQIIKLRPTFKLRGGMTMVDWFEVHSGHAYCIIKSGLRHADGETLSPFHCSICIGGKNAKKRCLKLFNDWWKKNKNNKRIRRIKKNEG